MSAAPIIITGAWLAAERRHVHATSQEALAGIDTDLTARRISPAFAVGAAFRVGCDHAAALARLAALEAAWREGEAGRPGITDRLAARLRGGT